MQVQSFNWWPTLGGFFGSIVIAILLVACGASIVFAVRIVAVAYLVTLAVQLYSLQYGVVSLAWGMTFMLIAGFVLFRTLLQASNPTVDDMCAEPAEVL